MIRVRVSFRGALSDTLYVVAQGANVPTVIGVRELLGGPQTISFLSTEKTIPRLQQKYGHDWEEWFFGGVSSLEPFRYRDETYVLARNSGAPRDVSAKAYVFKLHREDMSDVCMLRKVCPCGGCKDLRGAEKTLAAPAARLCGNR